MKLIAGLFMVVVFCRAGEIDFKFNGIYAKIDRLMGGRFWPAVHQWFLDRHGLAAELPSGASLPARSRVRIVPFAPDGEADFDGEKAQAARCQRRDRRTHAKTQW